MNNLILKFTFLTIFTIATSLFISAAPVSAELKYTMKLINDRYTSSYVEFTAKPLGCSDIEYKPNRGYYNFWRSKKCGGEQGQMQIDIFHDIPGTRKWIPLWRFNIDYSNSGEIKWYGPVIFNNRTRTYGGFIYIKNKNNVVCEYNVICKGKKFTIVVK